MIHEDRALVLLLYRLCHMLSLCRSLCRSSVSLSSPSLSLSFLCARIYSRPSVVVIPSFTCPGSPLSCSSRSFSSVGVSFSLSLSLGLLPLAPSFSHVCSPLSHVLSPSPSRCRHESSRRVRVTLLSLKIGNDGGDSPRSDHTATE